MSIRAAREIAEQKNPSNRKLSEALSNALKAYDRKAKAGPRAPTGEQFAQDIMAAGAGAASAYVAEGYVLDMMVPQDGSAATEQGRKRLLDVDRNVRLMLVALAAGAAFAVRKSKSRALRAYALGGAAYAGGNALLFFMMDEDAKTERATKLAAIAADKKAKANSTKALYRVGPQRARQTGMIADVRSGGTGDLRGALERLAGKAERDVRRRRSSSSSSRSSGRRVAIGARGAYAQSGYKR